MTVGFRNQKFGINGKNSELHAAVGLVNLRYADEILADRERQHRKYDTLLEELELRRPMIAADVEWNRSYYPVVFRSQEEALAVKDALEEVDILARRYFYPALNTLKYVENPGFTPEAMAVSKSILCLPLYYGLEDIQIAQICAEVVAVTTKFRKQIK